MGRDVPCCSGCQIYIDKLLLYTKKQYIFIILIYYSFVTTLIEVLKKILNDTTQKPITRYEAKELLKKLNCLESTLMAVFWGDILEILNKNRKKLQFVSIDLITVDQLYDSIIYYVSRNRNRFMDYENAAKGLSGLSDYKENEKRKRRRKLLQGENRSNEVTLSGRESFIIMTYFLTLHNLQSKLQKCKSGCKLLSKKIFKNFINITQHSVNEIRKSATDLCEVYSNDLNISFPSKVFQVV